MAVMDRDKYDIVPIGITHDGRWLTSGDPMAALTAGEPAAPPAEPQAAAGRELVPGATGSRFPPLDLIFPVLHGPYGEDGTVQGLLELAGVPYVGCGVLAGSLAMDKIASKEIFIAHGLPAPRNLEVALDDLNTGCVENCQHAPLSLKGRNVIKGLQCPNDLRQHHGVGNQGIFSLRSCVQ